MAQTADKTTPSRRPAGGQLGIDRAHYIALSTPDPPRAAGFAVERMGFELVHADAQGRHYLAGHGLDPYTLVYTPGDDGLDHVSLLVPDVGALDDAARSLSASGTGYEEIDGGQLWRHGPALRFQHLTGVTVELTTGVNVDVPMAALTPTPSALPAPISFDHVILRSDDVVGAARFNEGIMGLKRSGSIIAEDGIAVLDFYRCHTLYHCFGTARSDRNGLHHLQFSLKNDLAVFNTYEWMRERGDIELLWGPVRHGAGQNICFYFRDYAGNIVEYSAEEEVILHEGAYEADDWPITFQKAVDEWGSESPETMRG